MSKVSKRRGRPWKSLRRRLGHQFQALVGQELAPEKWVFVVGCYNSGTTLLTNLLDAHPALQALPREGVELSDALPRPEALGWPRMWAQCEHHVRIEPQGASASARAQRIRKQWSRYAPAAAAVVEKSIANMARLEFLAQHFAPAYFIYLVRNGFAVAEGIARRAKPRDWGNRDFERYPLELCARQWALSDEYFQRDRHALSHVLELRYEHLAENPDTAMGEITEFLSLPDFPANLATQTWDIHRVRSAIRNMNSDALARLTADDLDSIERVAGPTLQRYGYQRPESAH